MRINLIAGAVCDFVIEETLKIPCRGKVLAIRS